VKHGSLFHAYDCYYNMEIKYVVSFFWSTFKRESYNMFMFSFLYLFLIEYLANVLYIHTLTYSQLHWLKLSVSSTSNMHSTQTTLPKQLYKNNLKKYLRLHNTESKHTRAANGNPRDFKHFNWSLPRQRSTPMTMSTRS
jgi:hypothetical protein